MIKAGIGNFLRHPSEDVVVFKVLTSINPEHGDVVPGITVRSSARMGFLGVGADTIKKFDEVLVGNDVILLGYPTSLGLQNMPQIDSHRPLLRKGIVAGTNPKTHSIILDCPAYPGNSGSPVIESDPEGLGHRFKIIGVVNQYVPYADGGKTFIIMANSGYSLVTPMDYVMELVK